VPMLEQNPTDHRGKDLPEGQWPIGHG